MTKQQTSDTTLRELSRINAQFIDNHVRNDVAAHDQLLHSDFICISSNGRRIARSDYLKAWASLFDPSVIIHWDTRDELISVYGDVALVRATNKFIERRNGTEVTGMTCYTDTYVRGENGWRCVQAQLTDVRPEFWPGDETVISVYRNGIKQ